MIKMNVTIMMDVVGSSFYLIVDTRFSVRHRSGHPVSVTKWKGLIQWEKVNLMIDRD